MSYHGVCPLFAANKKSPFCRPGADPLFAAKRGLTPFPYAKRGLSPFPCFPLPLIKPSPPCATLNY